MRAASKNESINRHFCHLTVPLLLCAPLMLHAQNKWNRAMLDSISTSGSVSLVEPELLKKGVVNNALDALSGKAAGVNVTTNGLDRIAMLNSVRMRGTTSIMGGISSYTTMNTVRQTGIVSVNSSPTVTMGIIRNNNPDLKWETRSTWNIGADLGLWNNRLVLTAEYYYSKTTDMLYAYDVPVPPFAFDKLLANIGSMSNQGLELGFSITPISNQDMELNINMNLAWQKNKLLSLSGEYEGMQLSAAWVTTMGALSGAGQHGGYNDIVYQIVGQPFLGGLSASLQGNRAGWQWSLSL